MEDLSQVAKQIKQGFERLNATLDRIDKTIVDGVETSLDFVHALRRREGKHLHLVEDDRADDQSKE